MSSNTDHFNTENAVRDHNALETELNEWYQTSLKILCGVMLSLLLVRLGLGYIYKRLECQKLNYENVLQQYDAYSQLQDQNTLAQKRANAAAQLRDFLSTIGTLLPDDIRLENVSYEYGHDIYLEGTALKMRELLVFLDGVKRHIMSGRFSDSYPVSIEQDEQQEMLKFTVTIPFEALQKQGAEYGHY